MASIGIVFSAALLDGKAVAFPRIGDLGVTLRLN